MFIKQLYTDCLSQAAYYVESKGEAAVIDPMRDTAPYLELAKSRNAAIKYILETHFHADFISGHLELARKVEAPVVYHEAADTDYPVRRVKDGSSLPLGKCRIEVLHTPGHTPESVCYLLYDEDDKPHAVFTGDTLFVGDVGRPDLMGTTMTKAELAGMLYDSLRNKLMPLPGEVLVYPAHGAGSACGKHLGDKNWSTIAEQKETNYALQEMTKEEFIKAVTDGLAPPPKYFSLNARLNKTGYRSLDKIVAQSKRPLSVEAVEEKLQGKAILLDTRPGEQFSEAFIPGSYHIGLDGRFAEWVGKLLDEKTPVVLLTEPGKEEESILRMARVGYQHVEGYLDGGIKAWQQTDKPIDMTISIDPEEFELDVKHDEDIVILDVRSEQEYEDGHIDGSQNIPLEKLREAAGRFNDKDKIYIHCQTGYRSMAGSAILKRQHVNNVRNVRGGYEAICERNIPLYRAMKIASGE